MKHFLFLVALIYLLGESFASEETAVAQSEVVAEEDLKLKNATHRVGSFVSLLGKCISDHECKFNEYCDHTGINPIGSCKLGKELGASCALDRYCQTKQCHVFKCMRRKPERDATCQAYQHEECVTEQYCAKQTKDSFKCIDRKCRGFFCVKSAQCLSNRCFFFWCMKPDNGCPAPTNPK